MQKQINKYFGLKSPWGPRSGKHLAPLLLQLLLLLLQQQLLLLLLPLGGLLGSLWRIVFGIAKSDVSYAGEGAPSRALRKLMEATG